MRLRLLFRRPVGLALAALTATGQQSRTGTEWLRYGLTPGETRYSPLNQINAANVSRLGLAWSYDVGDGGGNQEATPLYSNGTIYSITNWSIVYAIDVRTGKERWRWIPEVNQTAVRPKLCCGVVNRGLALYQGENHRARARRKAPRRSMPVYRQVGLGSACGVPAGELYDYDGSPDRQRQGNHRRRWGRVSGARILRRLRCRNRQARAWKFYTVPGDPSKPFENDAMRKAAATWSGEWWKLGGGATVWDAMAYDPDANLLYVGTGNAGPWPREIRRQERAGGASDAYTPPQSSP